MTKMKRLIQAAGVRSVEEARMLAGCGMTHIGLPLRLPVHKEDVSEEEARTICEAVNHAGAQSVLITYLTDPAETLSLCRFLGVGGLQLHGAMPLAAVRELRQAAPWLFVIKSLVIGMGKDLDHAEAALTAQAREHAPYVDAFLTDTFDPSTGASGATGKVHDWAVSRRLAQALPKPLILAGGLTPANVAEAIAAVRPAGVDAHTGLEDASGAKDPELCRRFVAEALRGFAGVDQG